MLVAFSVAPTFDSPPASAAGAPEKDSPEEGPPEKGLSAPVAKAVKVVRDSGLPNSTNAMFTNIEGSWDEVMSVVKNAVEAAGEGASRISLVLKADIRPGYDQGQLTAKVERLEEHLS
jgi:uncharacterized protein YqgV (UPF0045/DUF77 family)